MVYRYMFRGYPNDFDIKLKDNGDVNNVSVYRYEDSVLVYAESYLDNIKGEDVVDADVKAYPDGKLWENMADIFHYSAPQSDESWKRKQDKEPILHVNKLRHEKVSGYIYYHYQYQEEMPCDGDKYGIIFISGDMIFMYMENPTEYAEPYKGSLDTNACPVRNNWTGLMNQHFDMSFSDGKWLGLERIL